MPIEFARAFVQQFGLTPEPDLVWESEDVGGGVAARLRLEPWSDGARVRLELTPPHRRADLYVCGRALWLGPDGALTPLGDDAFDAAVALRVGRPETLGHFDLELRELLLRVMERDVVVIDEGVVIAFLGGLPDAEAAAIAHEALLLAERLAADDATLSARLIHLSLTDPEPGVRDAMSARIEADTQLRRRRAEHRAGLAAAERPRSGDGLVERLHDRDLPTEQRVSALLELFGTLPLRKIVPHIDKLGALFGQLASTDKGAPFTELVERIAALLMVPDVDRDGALAVIRALLPFRPGSRVKLDRQISRLLAHLAHPQSLDLVTELLATRDDAQFRAALTALEAITDDLETMAMALGPEGQRRLTSVAVELSTKTGRGASLLRLAYRNLTPTEVGRGCEILARLGEVGDARHEAFLIHELDSYSDPIRDAAIAALGSLGGELALERLQPLTGGLFRSSNTKMLARRAIEGIRERMGRRSSPGALSLADGRDGSLSLSDE